MSKKIKQVEDGKKIVYGISNGFGEYRKNKKYTRKERAARIMLRTGFSWLRNLSYRLWPAESFRMEINMAVDDAIVRLSREVPDWPNGTWHIEMRDPAGYKHEADIQNIKHFDPDKSLLKTVVQEKDLVVLGITGDEYDYTSTCERMIDEFQHGGYIVGSRLLFYDGGTAEDLLDLPLDEHVKFCKPSIITYDDSGLSKEAQNKLQRFTNIGIKVVEVKDLWKTMLECDGPKVEEEAQNGK